MWSLIPDKLKQLVDIHSFNKEIKKGKQKIAYLGYIKRI